ncbi:MAG: helicase UvrD [Verrucomicrobiales bacterium]|nr:helicase UvrD [Verrucomicrobiales bacterium]
MQIDITQEDIDNVAHELQLELTDPEIVAVLKETATCDVQAGPGSGKTTALTAKLAILAKKWPYRDRGICVLSHTNVARIEIERKLSQSPGMRSLLHYPHFIGTMQTFVNQFLAIPFLRREKVEVTAIDNDRFGGRAWGVFLNNHSSALYALKMACRQDIDVVKGVIASLRFDGANMRVAHSREGGRFPGPASASGKALIELKNTLRTEGYFRYDDMYAYGESCLVKVPYVAKILRHRFPWVFVDELQDTSEMQDRIIEQLFFANGCVFQRFGDKNQAIFDFDTDEDRTLSLFRRPKTLYLNTTHRFSNSIAKFVSQMTVVEPQQLNGNPKRPNYDHTVFIFEKSAIKQVIPAFGDLVLKTVPAEIYKTRPVYAVGNRVNHANHTRDNTPAYLGDYFAEYFSPNAEKLKLPDTLLGYIMEARKKWEETKTGGECYNSAVSGILALLRRCGRDEVRNKTTLHQDLLQKGTFAAFQKLMWQFLNPTVTLDQKVWASLTAEIPKLLGLSAGSEMNEFLAWEVHKSQSAGTIQMVKQVNVHVHRSGTEELPIYFDSIHGVKGETHAATLVTETFSRQHDLKALLPILTATQKAHELQGQDRGHGKRIFVGMSRPSHLLCLAISSGSINDQGIRALENGGWKIVKIPTAT